MPALRRPTPSRFRFSSLLRAVVAVEHEKAHQSARNTHAGAGAILQVVVGPRIIGAKRTNLHEKYDYPSNATHEPQPRKSSAGHIQ
jgi:hypothetical protein